MALKALSLIYQVAKLSEKNGTHVESDWMKLVRGGRQMVHLITWKVFFFFFKSPALFQSVSNINLSQMVLCNKPSGTSGCNATGAEMLCELICASLENLRSVSPPIFSVKEQMNKSTQAITSWWTLWQQHRTILQQNQPRRGLAEIHGVLYQTEAYKSRFSEQSKRFAHEISNNVLSGPWDSGGPPDRACERSLHSQGQPFPCQQDLRWERPPFFFFSLLHPAPLLQSQRRTGGHWRGSELWVAAAEL